MVKKFEIGQKRTNKIGKYVCDRDKNRFFVKGYTLSRQRKINGVTLVCSRGRKEVSLRDLKFFKKCR